MARVLTAMITAINSGDQAVLRRFITANFALEAGGPSLDERLERMGRMHENLGEITIEKIETLNQALVEMTLKSSLQGGATLRVMTSGAEPYLIQSLQILIGS